MINVVKIDSVPQGLHEEMDNFEQSFRYPLGENSVFRVSHGEDYGRFYRSIGKSRIYLARRNSEVVGSMAVVERTMCLNSKQQKALYVGDLKIKPQAGGKVLYCLIKEAFEDFKELRLSPHYSVMVKGSTRRPSDYTGRLGLPKFEKMGEVAVLRVPVTQSGISEAYQEISLSAAQTLAEELKDTDCSSPLTRAGIRSDRTPRGYTLKDKSAVCILEDTLAAKRLYYENGEEIISGHLSSFQYWKAASAVKLLKSIMPQAHALGYPALFFAVPVGDSEYFCSRFRDVQVAKAYIFGRNMRPGQRWQINTSEI